ncbi:hypothetical protein AACH06_13740 [Ideonella sp. DXS29W]|uniref:HAF repeat-containing protein n=1 Tax=Ideonella lacteola TaxID=2984193 RepID=A0ABU9BPI9_9BURK
MAFARFRCSAVLLAIAALSAPSLVLAESFEGRDICHCYVTGLSADGTAATGQLNGSNQTFHWTWVGGAQPLGRGTMRKLQTGAGTPAISADGKVVAATIMDDTRTYGTQGRWTAETGWQQLMPPRPADGAIVDRFDGGVFGMSGDGQTITGLYWRNTAAGGLAHASRWTKGGVVNDMGSGGGSSRADDANADGTVLVGWDEDPVHGQRRAAVWVHGVKTVLDDSDWPSEAGAVNASGTIIVGQAYDPATQRTGAAMWTWTGSAWQLRHLGVLPGTQVGGMAYATGLSDDGKTVVGTARRFFSPSNRGFIWTEDAGMVEAGKYFKDRGYNVGKKIEIQSVSAISADGQVMGVAGVELSTGATRSIAVRRVSAAAR